MFDIISNLEETSYVLKTATPTIINQLNNCFVESKSTRLVKTIDWPSHLNDIIFRNDDTIISQ